MTRVNSGIDYEAKVLGGDTPLGFRGTSSSGTPPTATVLTDSGTPSPAWSAGQWKGHSVVTGNVVGVIVDNTTTTITVSGWVSALDPGNPTAAATPAGNITYTIMPGQAPAWFIGLSTATRTIAAADTFLTNDGTTVSELWASGGGLNRKIAAWAHTAGVGSYTLTTTFTSNTNDGGAVTVHRIGVFGNNVFAAPTTTTSGVMLFETNLTNDAVLVPTSNDSVQVTETVSI